MTCVLHQFAGAASEPGGNDNGGVDSLWNDMECGGAALWG